MALTGITGFLSAILLFLVEPTIAKPILPAFGGSVAGHLPAGTLPPKHLVSGNICCRARRGWATLWATQLLGA